VKVETGEYSTYNPPIMMYPNTIKNIKKKAYNIWFQYFLTVIAGMNSDSAAAAEYLS
jgi:hypothetical protein